MTAAFLGVVWFFVAFTPLCSFLARGLPRYDLLKPADAVFVLGSFMQHDGELSTDAMSRLVRGLELLAQGLASRLIVSELLQSTDEVEAATRQLMHNLRIDGEVLTVSRVANSHDEAVAVAALCRERGWSILLVVTSPLHSRRACAAVEHEGIEVICFPSVETHFNVRHLTEPDERLRAFAPILHEWLGLGSIAAEAGSESCEGRSGCFPAPVGEARIGKRCSRLMNREIACVGADKANRRRYGGGCPWFLQNNGTLYIERRSTVSRLVKDWQGVVVDKVEVPVTRYRSTLYGRHREVRAAAVLQDRH